MGKVLTIITCLLITGCSSARSVGDLELLNNTELETVREVLKTYDKTANTVGHYRQDRSIDTGKVNRAYGHIKNFQHTNIPQTVQDVQDIERYLE